MKTDLSQNNLQFDDFVSNYDSALEQGLSVSGEHKEYFSKGRITWLKKCLQNLSVQPKTALDFGCGTGSTTQYFVDVIGVDSILGVDSSAKSIDFAKRNYGSEYVEFMPISGCQPNGQIDLAFCNGVFHHIPVEARLGAVQFINQSLRPAGLFA